MNVNQKKTVGFGRLDKFWMESDIFLVCGCQYTGEIGRASCRERVSR